MYYTMAGGARTELQVSPVKATDCTSVHHPSESPVKTGINETVQLKIRDLHAREMTSRWQIFEKWAVPFEERVWTWTRSASRWTWFDQRRNNRGSGLLYRMIFGLESVHMASNGDSLFLTRFTSACLFEVGVIYHQYPVNTGKMHVFCAHFFGVRQCLSCSVWCLDAQTQRSRMFTYMFVKLK